MNVRTYVRLSIYISIYVIGHAKMVLTSRMLEHYGASVSEVADNTEARSEHSNADKIKKRRTVANSVTSVGESGDRDPCVGASVASLGVNTRP